MLLKWGAHKKRLHRRVIIMVRRGIGHGRGHGRGQENTKNVNELIEIMRTMMDRMDAIEATKRRGITHVIRDENVDEEELGIIRDEPEEQMTMEEIILRAINNIGGKPRLDTPIYFDSLNPEELIDWIRKMEKFFELEHIRDPLRVRLASTKLSHASLW